MGAADGAYFALLKRAEQLHLYFVVEVPHLVEKQRAAVGRLEGSLLVLVGPRESSLDIAENSEAATSRGMAPQSRAKNGLSARGLSSWMRRATYSFPVPLAPRMSTDMGVGATSDTKS